MKKNTKREHKINQEIRVPQVRVVGEGIIASVQTLSEALALAESKDMDLVLINEQSNPPVAKIMKYEKYLYEQTKRPKQKVLEVKEIRLTPNTSDNDLDYRTRHIIEFLNKGHKVKISLRFKGREMAYTNRGQELLLKLALAVEDHGTAETMPNLEGKQMFLTIRPKIK